MKPLETRKRLLIAESELNRAQLVQELDAMTVSVRTLTHRVKSYGSIASGAVLLVTALAALRRGKVHTHLKSSWLQMIRKGAGLVFTLWPAFRKKHEHKNTDPASHV